jgi:excisionase family DNA binding protein
MPDLADYMTTEEAARKLGFHVKSIRNMLASGKLEGIKVGTAWLVSRKSVEKYLKETAGMSKNDPRRGQN